jgi:5,10-methylenetetrahydromethanopterin reductase
LDVQITDEGHQPWLFAWRFLTSITKKETTHMQRVALYLQDAHPIRDGMKFAQYAEQRGFEAVWQAESRLVRDAIVPMSAYAAVTERIKVGSGVINNWTRNIGLLAATFLTLDDLAPDRIICGIGAWWDPLAQNVGITRRKPLLAMRETVEVMRRLLAMENVTFEGEFHQVTGVELDVVHGRREPRHVPIYVGASGRDRRRYRVELLCASRIQRRGDGAIGTGRQKGWSQP